VVLSRRATVDATLRDPSWTRIGKIAGWTNGLCYIAAAVIFLLVELEITWTPADTAGDESLITKFVAFFAAERDKWPQELTYSILFAVGFLALVPIGLALRDFLGRQLATSQMVAASFLAAGAIGAVAQLAFIGGKEAILDASQCPGCEDHASTLVSLNSSLTSLDGIVEWVGLGFFLLAGTGILFASVAAFEQPAFARNWIRLGLIVGALYLAGIIASVADLETLFEGIVGIRGGILAPAWAIWFALQLKKSDVLPPPEETPIPAKV
jgi:hypothetical protein